MSIMRTSQEMIARFNKRASLPKFKSNEILSLLDIQSGNNILEIGIGGGFYAAKFAEKIGPDGCYVGLDTNREFIDYVNSSCQFNNIKCIEFHDKVINEINERFDLVFTRNTYHHLTNRSEYFKKIKTLLKPTARVAIMDYNEKLSMIMLRGHYTKKSIIIEEMREAGFALDKDYPIVRNQSFVIFKISD